MSNKEKLNGYLYVHAALCCYEFYVISKYVIFSFCYYFHDMTIRRFSNTYTPKELNTLALLADIISIIARATPAEVGAPGPLHHV